ncbi:MAG: hypothetical protein DMF60_03045 [Acidobacteria bacterium]|nr:MAG: hypothetical protein DMF60_03045 [Acidobacteriota bacterium]
MGIVKILVKSRLKQTPIYPLLNRLRLRAETKRRAEADSAVIAEWEHCGRLVPPPDALKQRTVRQYGERFSLKSFVETGTFLGDMVDAVRGGFKTIYSIELDSALFEKAKTRFSTNKNIALFRGDSGDLLPQILRDLREPSLFWLDAHYSCGFTARGDLDTPILAELASILQHDIPGHVILVDDARCFNGEHDYPTIERLREFVLGRRPELAMKVEDDIIRIHPFITQGYWGPAA